MRLYNSLRQIATFLGLFLGASEVLAQAPGISMGFRNDTKSPIIIQGTTKVNNMPRRGQPIFIPAARMAHDSSVPAGTRYINIYDAQQPSRILLADFPLLIGNRDLAFKVVPSPTQRDRVVLVPEP